MWELDHKERWVQKNWCFWTVVLEKTLESPLKCKEIQPVHPKGDQSWTFIGKTDAKAETAKLWPPDAKSWLIWKDLDAGKDWRQEEKGATEDDMVEWHHQLNGHGFGGNPGVGDGQGGLVCCSSWGLKESDTTEQRHWTEVNASTVENSTEISQKVKNDTALWYNNATLGYLSKENNSTNSKGTCPLCSLEHCLQQPIYIKMQVNA